MDHNIKFHQIYIQSFMAKRTNFESLIMHKIKKGSVIYIDLFYHFLFLIVDAILSSLVSLCKGLMSANNIYQGKVYTLSLEKCFESMFGIV